MMAPPTWFFTTGIARKSCTIRAGRSRCKAANPASKEGARSHERGPTWLRALGLCPADYLGGDRRAAHRATGLPGRAWVVRKGAIPMPQTHHETHVTKNEVCQPSAGQEASKAGLVPTALMGPAQRGREPYPIILPHIAIGRAVVPNVPALPAVRASAGASLAIERSATLVLTPETNGGKGQETGAHEQHPKEEGGAQEPIAPPPKASPEQKSG